jgi:hypothetical protein
MVIGGRVSVCESGMQIGMRTTKRAPSWRSGAR